MFRGKSFCLCTYRINEQKIRFFLEKAIINILFIAHFSDLVPSIIHAETRSDFLFSDYVCMYMYTRIAFFFTQNKWNYSLA